MPKNMSDSTTSQPNGLSTLVVVVVVVDAVCALSDELSLLRRTVSSLCIHSALYSFLSKRLTVSRLRAAADEPPSKLLPPMLDETEAERRIARSSSFHLRHPLLVLPLAPLLPFISSSLSLF